MKQIVLALAVGVALFATVAFAASLGGVTADQLGAGDALVTSCDTDGVTLNWRTQLQDNVITNGGYTGQPGFQVIAVEISGIDTNCDGQHLLLSVSKAGSHIFMGRVPTALSGATAVADEWYYGGGWTTGTGPMAIDIDDIHILIKENLVAYDG